MSPESIVGADGTRRDRGSAYGRRHDHAADGKSRSSRSTSRRAATSSRWNYMHCWATPDSSAYAASSERDLPPAEGLCLASEVNGVFRDWAMTCDLGVQAVCRTDDGRVAVASFASCCRPRIYEAYMRRSRKAGVVRVYPDMGRRCEI